jgi:uroporphyrinogen decarboxylase
MRIVPDSLTPRERWVAVLSRERPDRLPMEYWGTAEATRKLMDHVGSNDWWEMCERLHIDPVVPVIPKYSGPALRKGFDVYGCGLKSVDYGSGAYEECVYHPLARYNSIDEIEANYTWPTADWFDYSVIADQVRGKDRYPARGGGSEPFLIYARLRGLEQAFMDLVLNPDLVLYALDRLFDFCYEQTIRIYEQIPGQVTMSYVSEDFGSQENLLFSPKTIREFFVPRMKRMIDLAHQAGVFVFFHSDGAIRPIIGDMIEAGIDVLNPIQWRSKGMDREQLAQDFAGRVVFHGGVDNQYTLAFGSVTEVRDEVAYNIEVLGKNGGYILAPCHNIQAVSPPENVVAMYEAGYEYGHL